MADTEALADLLAERDELRRKLQEQALIYIARDGECMELLAERERLRAEAASWKEQLWALARVLNCLPSTYSDANAHVYKKAEKVMAELEQGRADVRELVDALQTAIWRLDDMLRGDDGQAWKEAERAMPPLRALLAKHKETT